MCVCRVKTETFTPDPTLMPKISLFVAYEGEPLPGYHPVRFPFPCGGGQGGASTLTPRL